MIEMASQTHGKPLLVAQFPNENMARFLFLEAAGCFILLGIFFAYMFGRFHFNLILAIVLVSCIFLIALPLMIVHFTYCAMELFFDGLVPHKIPFSALFDDDKRFIPFSDVQRIQVTRRLLGSPPKLSAHCAITKKNGWEQFILLTSDDDLSLFIGIAKKNGVDINVKDMVMPKWMRL